MRHQRLAQTTANLWVRGDPSSPFVPQCDRKALDLLGRSYSETRPLAVLIGEGRDRLGHVVDRFLSEIASDADVVRITEPYLDSTSCMRGVIRGLGFQPKDLSLKDLENILRMFLAFQKTHHRRTILFIEDAQDTGEWVLDKVRALVEMEMRNGYGLMIILAGSRRLNDLLDASPLDTVFTRAGKRISVPPFELDETREYVRRLIEPNGADDVGQVFEFQAVNLIHELSAGVPDMVNTLCHECCQLADEEGTVPVTTDLVKLAAESLHLTSLTRMDADDRSLELDVPAAKTGRLVVRMKGKVIQERALDKERILIGRDQICDICIASKVVSRQHALVISSSEGVAVVDLDSTNGTVFKGRKIQRCELESNQAIVVGNCRVEYVAPESALQPSN